MSRPEIILESPHPFDITLDRLRQAVPQEKFSIVFETDIQERLTEKGFDQQPTVIVGVCNARHAHIALQADPRIVTMLPCRIAVYVLKGKTYVATMNVGLIAQFYEGDEVAAVAAEVGESLSRVMEFAVS